jgi:ribA/ribD-fused uncharacterized protein
MKLGIYRHYKNKEYEVLGVSKDTDNLTDYVVYKTLYDNDVSKLWVRKLDEFNELIVIDGVEIPRFVFISNLPIKFKGGGYNVFSNFAAFKVIYNNEEWMTSEHAYHASKFLDKDIQTKIQQTPSAYEAKMLAQEYQKEVRSDWKDINLSIMKDIIVQKVKQHPYVQKKLLSSFGTPIVEGTDDEFWGQGKNGEGKNMFGKMWEEVRRELLD